MKRLICLLAVLPLCCSTFAADRSLSYVALVNRLTDLGYLATLPVAGEQCAQCSSYDRRSRYDEATDKYINWDANGDGGGIIRKEGDKSVLAEMQGPGCIWRIWSATPKEGHVRIYLDSADEPAVDLPFSGYFDGKNAPFTRPALVHTVARGWNNYTPIPYQKSCKVVADPGWGLYYHFTYGTFPKGTQVPTFKGQLSAEEESALDTANQVLSGCGPRQDDHLTWASNEGHLASGDAWTQSTTIDGPAAITDLRIKVEQVPAGPASFDALRALTLQIRWDGEPEPSVWAPLGDFFGTAPGANQYKSLPLGLTEDGWWYCNWIMPFAKRAEVTIKKEGQLSAKVSYRVGSRPLKGDLSRYARFHAKWHRDAFPPVEPERRIDWPILKTEGAGRFVGVMLHIWNPRGGWWGEGDEKFFVDGEKFPSTFGTGSEDYFGYAWSDAGLFQHAFHNQTHNDGASKGHISVNRWHIPDNVPFEKSFEGCIEKYFPNQRPTLYAAMAYWYLAPGGKDPYQPLPLSERIGYWTPVQAFKVAGAIEGESLKILGKTGGNPHEQGMGGFAGEWSNDAHLWWTDAKPGDKLDLALPVAKAGKYKLSGQLTKAPDYGIVQLYLDGKKLGEPIDLYHSSVVPTGPMALGEFDLEAGTHKLTAEITGANDKAVKNYMFGLDYVKLESQP
ncbi:MAG TPA: DUF2961 domain-containing protein [Candidatus Binatia bacterium]|jgi:hypothetical protein|nr:DUF2961 domain-containing protein [Candidatus Binatia bacterium]